MFNFGRNSDVPCGETIELKWYLRRCSVLKTLFSAVCLIAVIIAPAYSSADELFKSSFEQGVDMSDFIPGSKWTKTITGSDQGYDWGTDLPGGSNNFWNLILDRSAYPNPSECLDLDISSNQSKSGSRSLHMKVLKRCSYNGVNARVSYLPSMGNWPYDQTYIKYWLKLPASFAANLRKDGQSGTANFNELRMNDANLRIIFDVVTVDGGDLKFRIFSDDISSGWNPHWIKTSNEPVPIDQWFKVEIYFNVKTYAEGGGVYWVKINGKKILEVIPTATMRICGKSVTSKTCENPSDWNLIKLYTWENYPIEAYLDDLEIRNALDSNGSGDDIDLDNTIPAPVLRLITGM